MTEKYKVLHDAAKKEIEEIFKFDSIEEGERIVGTYNQDELRFYLADCLKKIADTIKEIDAQRAEDLLFDAKMFSKNNVDLFDIAGIDDMVHEPFIEETLYHLLADNSISAEMMPLVEDVCAGVNAKIYGFEPNVFPLLSDDGKADYLNGWINNWCKVNKDCTFAKDNFTEENYYLEVINSIVNYDSSLSYLNKDNIQNIEQIKDTLNKINEMKDFDILDDSIEQENAEKIKNILSKIVSIAESSQELDERVMEEEIDL